MATPGEAYRKGFPWVPVILIGGFVIVGIIFLLITIFQPWAQKIDTSNAKHQVAIQQISASAYANNPGAQQADIDAMENAMGSISSGNSPATNAFDAGQACKFFARILPAALPPGDQSWTSTNCAGSQVKPGSPYYVAP